MSPAILPPGWSITMLRKKLDKELHQAKAAELAQATTQDRKRIETEIQAEVDRQYPTPRNRVAEFVRDLWTI
jgi:hypothetical protein